MMDAEAFASALRPLLRQSAGYASSLLGGRNEAQDAVQQAALRAWERRVQFDTGRPFRAWWFGILRHHCLDVLRAERWRPTAVPLDVVELSIDPDEGVIDRVALDAALGRLAELSREMLQLRYFGELSYEEIALVLAIPKGTVMSRLHSARKALAAAMMMEALP